jgi:TolA-binding protein
MSRAPFTREPAELLRRLAEEPVPSAPEDASPARRDRLVRSMKDAVERSAESAEKARRFRRGSLIFAAAASLLLLSGLLLNERRAHGSGPIAGLDRVSGTVVLTQEGNVQVVGAGQRPLRDGDSLQTAAGARAHLTTHKSSVDVSESTELKLSQPNAAEERISLRHGRVDVAVDKTVETKRSVVVETPDAEVVVRGTVFDVRVEPLANATNTRVHVTRGSVWVLSQGVQVALLSAGQSWNSAGGIEAAAPPPAPAAPVAAQEPESAPVAKPSAPNVAKEPRKSGTLAEENRLFSAGVEARNRGDARSAAELFGELLSTYPQSTLREVAQVEHFRALNQAGQTARAAGEARRYLAEHADGAARAEARDLALDK